MTKEQLKVGDRVTFTYEGKDYTFPISLIDPPQYPEPGIFGVHPDLGSVFIRWTVFSKYNLRSYTPTPEIPSKEYPHVCRCGKKAYIGFNMIDHADGRGCG